MSDIITKFHTHMRPTCSIMQKSFREHVKEIKTCFECLTLDEYSCWPNFHISLLSFKIIVRALLLINLDGSYIPFSNIVVFLKTISIVFTYEYLRLYIYNISTFQIMQMIHLDIRVDVFIVRSNSCFSEKFFLSKQDMNSMFTSNFAKILLR